MYFNYQEYSLPRQTLFGQGGGGSDGGSGGDAVGQHHRHPSWRAATPGARLGYPLMDVSMESRGLKCNVGLCTGRFKW